MRTDNADSLNGRTEKLISMVREVFARKAHDPAVIQKGVVKGLPPLVQAAE